jgi:hypothetical protein
LVSNAYNYLQAVRRSGFDVRPGLAQGDANYTDLEDGSPRLERSRCRPLQMEGGANCAPRPETSAYAKMFSAKYWHWTHHRRHQHRLPMSTKLDRGNA